MATFVLVHGAFGGAHGWHKVRPLLWAQGHQVFTPSLTGIGERAHLASPQVTLSTHIQDVVNCVEYEGLRDIVLVGFSYGGNVVTGAVDYIGDRIQHMVYLDAALPKDGDSSRPPGIAYRMGESWLVEGPPRVYDDPAEGEWSKPRRSAQPLGTFTEPVRLSKPIEEWPFSRTYILCNAPNHERNPESLQRSAYTRVAVPRGRDDAHDCAEPPGRPRAAAARGDRLALRAATRWRDGASIPDTRATTFE